ncbi:MAG: helix-turn-helix domain-containing protein [Termitinemataceae bacterium]
MRNREIKRERIRRYFLDAAKELLLSEGVAGVTAKKVGDKAAYSYGSIYNYFENQNALLCEALEELAEDCAVYVKEQLDVLASGGARSEPQEPSAVELQDLIPHNIPEAERRVLVFSYLMIEYNGSNPHRYAPFLSTEIDFTYFIRRDGHHFMHPAYGLLLKELEKVERFTQEKRRLIADIMVYIFHSKMHFFIRYGTPATLAELHREVQEEVRLLLWP